MKTKLESIFEALNGSGLKYEISSNLLKRSTSIGIRFYKHVWYWFDYYVFSDGSESIMCIEVYSQNTGVSNKGIRRKMKAERTLKRVLKLEDL